MALAEVDVVSASAAQHASDPYADLEFVQPSYFAALGVRMLSGRSFDRRETSSAEPTVVISKSVADHHWPGQSAVGKTRYRDLTTSHLTVYRLSHQAPDPVFAPRGHRAE